MLGFLAGRMPYYNAILATVPTAESPPKSRIESAPSIHYPERDGTPVSPKQIAELVEDEPVNLNRADIGDNPPELVAGLRKQWPEGYKQWVARRAQTIGPVVRSLPFAKSDPTAKDVPRNRPFLKPANEPEEPGVVNLDKAPFP